MGRECNAIGNRQLKNILFKNPEWMRPFRRPKHRCENNINMDLKYIGRVDVDLVLWFKVVTDYGLL
jgi:hypothetical protein